MSQSEYIALVLECVRTIGEMDGNPALVDANEKTKLFGPSGNLDSMDLVTLTVEIEQRVSERFNRNIVLADEKAMSRATSPFRNVESLAEYMGELLQKDVA